MVFDVYKLVKTVICKYFGRNISSLTCKGSGVFEGGRGNIVKEVDEDEGTLVNGSRMVMSKQTSKSLKYIYVSVSYIRENRPKEVSRVTTTQ